tara:strand:+ start:298 stop:489 length:192 start_codon:yes stop_codon:yes gene_type:complete
MKIPKTISNHPLVSFTDLGDNQGCAEYKYWVELKLNYVFDGYFSGVKGFNSVKDFTQTEIIER